MPGANLIYVWNKSQNVNLCDSFGWVTNSKETSVPLYPLSAPITRESIFLKQSHFLSQYFTSLFAFWVYLATKTPKPSLFWLMSIVTGVDRTEIGCRRFEVMTRDHTGGTRIYFFMFLGISHNQLMQRLAIRSGHYLFFSLCFFVQNHWLAYRERYLWVTGVFWKARRSQFTVRNNLCRIWLCVCKTQLFHTDLWVQKANRMELS